MEGTGLQVADGRGAPANGRIGSSGSTARKGAARFDIDLNELPGLKAAAQADALRKALEGFRAEARKTPTERCREQVMKEWHVTPESLAAMPPEEARQLERRIEAEVTRRLHAGADQKPVAAPVDAPASPAADEGEGRPSTLDALLARSAPTAVVAPD